MPALLSRLTKFSLNKSKRKDPAVIFVLSSLGVLLGTTIFWSILGAKINLTNADQLADPYLFSNHAVLSGASFPGQHTFLIKWPIFWIISLLHFSNFSYYFFTVLVSLVTVGGLAYLLYRLDKRPWIFGALCLALASVFIAIPAAPYAGVILPLNMAMLASRNIEYLLFIVSLYLLAKSSGIKSSRFVLGTVLLGLLIASDKLFLSMSLGAALLALVYYALKSKWQQVSLSVNWLVATAISAAVAIALLGIINSAGITHVAGQATSPYGLIHSFKDLALGLLYGGLGLLSNFGANPASNAVIARQVPAHFVSGLFSLGFVTYLVNICLFIASLGTAVWLIRVKSVKSIGQKTGVMLIWATLAALAVFVLSNHYFAVDGRYLGIAPFAGFACLALYLRTRKYNQRRIAIVSALLIVAVGLGLINAVKTYHADTHALAQTNNENSAIAQALERHKVGTLVGDYWRVFPIRQQMPTYQPILPLLGCSQIRSALASKAWDVDLRATSFAYILSLNKGLTDYPACHLSDAISAYGRPNSSLLISGSIEKPSELLLFYDHGANKSEPAINPAHKDPATVTPISTDELPYTTCDGPTIMNIVAHQDDDLLFINPDTQKDISAGHCIRTIYITAGDAGSGSFYWLSRQQGSEAAYSTMAGSSSIWVQRLVKLANNEYVSVANPRGNSKISLIFMNLPDGNLKGEGFASSKFESLAKLQGGKITTLNSVDGQSSYSDKQLVSAVSTLMHVYQPTEIRTQANDTSPHFPDHSDHLATGQLTKAAYQLYEQQQFEDRVTIPISFYMGYPIHDLPENVSGSDLAKKEQAFFAYGAHDGGTCTTMAQCEHGAVYGFYLKRQYIFSSNSSQTSAF